MLHFQSSTFYLNFSGEKNSAETYYLKGILSLPSKCRFFFIFVNISIKMMLSPNLKEFPMPG